MSLDPRLAAATELDRAALRWWELADEATERCAEAKRRAREIREQVDAEQEVRMLQAEADRISPMRRRRTA